MGQDPDKQVAWVVIRFGVVVSALVEDIFQRERVKVFTKYSNILVDNKV